MQADRSRFILHGERIQTIDIVQVAGNGKGISFSGRHPGHPAPPPSRFVLVSYNYPPLEMFFGMMV